MSQFNKYRLFFFKGMIDMICVASFKKYSTMSKDVNLENLLNQEFDSILNIPGEQLNIIMANLHIKGGLEIDVIDTVRKLCDPICSFHENAEFKPKRKHLINYLKDVYSIDKNEKITKCEIMLCDGTETDILNID